LVVGCAAIADDDRYRREEGARPGGRASGGDYSLPEGEREAKVGMAAGKSMREGQRNAER